MVFTARLLEPQRHTDAVGWDGSDAENSPKASKKKKGKKKLLDREDYSASVHSSDVESQGETDSSSMAPDDLLAEMIKGAKKRGFTSNLAQGYTNKLDENYCGLCGLIHTETCHMVQSAENLVQYRAMLMEVTNEEPIEIRVSPLT